MNLVSYIRHPESRSVGVLFLINALVIGNWLVRIPDIKYALGLNDAQLGMALLGAPLGVIVFTPIATWIMNRYGVGRAVIFSASLMISSVIGLGMVGSFYQLTFALFFFGGFNGVLDISMNGVANAVEQRISRVIMSTSHGFWSLGAMVAAFVASLIAASSLSYFNHFLLVAFVGLIMLATVARRVWPITDVNESKFKWVWPGWLLIIYSLVALIILLVEGAIADWSALYYEEVIQSPKELVGWGFAFFSGTMAIARFFGDTIIEKFPNRTILIIASLIATTGLFLFAQNDTVLWCCLAMMLTGVGCSVIVPIMFREAGNSKKVTPSFGLALVSMIGYAGFLIGPPIMGFIAEATDLSFSFLFLAGMMVVVFLLSLLVK